MKTTLLIFIGGGLGSVARYFLGNWMPKMRIHPDLQDVVFPLGTLTVNLVACLLVGLLAGLGGQRDPAARALLIIGFCGGFSTFSSFTLELTGLTDASTYGLAVLYIALSLFGCLGATFLGLWLAGRA
jgi:CrcB protein